MMKGVAAVLALSASFGAGAADAKVSPMLGQAEPHPSASDGYWLLVAPPAKGRHTIKFTARYGTVISGGLEQDVEYELRVN